MADPVEGEFRIINHAGMFRKTINGVTKYDPTKVFQIRQQLQAKATVPLNGGSSFYKTLEWVDVEWVE